MKPYYCFDGAGVIHYFDTLEEAKHAAVEFTRKQTFSFPANNPVSYGEVRGYSVETSRRRPGWFEVFLYGNRDIVTAEIVEVK